MAHHMATHPLGREMTPVLSQTTHLTGQKESGPFLKGVGHVNNTTGGSAGCIVSGVDTFFYFFVQFT